MRKYILLATASLLSACGGGGGGGSPVQSPGGISLPGQVGSGHTFVDPKEQRTYQAIGAVHTYQYRTGTEIDIQLDQLYQGNSSTPRNSGITVDYNPRDAIFALTIREPLAGSSENLRYQDPLHRTDHDGQRTPQGGVPNVGKPGINYLQAGNSSGVLRVLDPATAPANELRVDGSWAAISNVVPAGEAGYKRDVTTFFYQKPGTTTNFVTFAGYVRNTLEVIPFAHPVTAVVSLEQKVNLQRGAFVYGERTIDSAVPRIGSGTYTGSMIATMIFNPLLDDNSNTPTYFQWIDGTAVTQIDFANSSFKIDMTGIANAPQFDVFTSGVSTIQAGATFTASGSGRIDLVHTGGFVGQFQSARFDQPGGGGRRDINVGGSSVDGGFFGPLAQEVGGGFRIVGGTPDERIDILGAFTGKRP